MPALQSPHLFCGLSPMAGAGSQGLCGEKASEPRREVSKRLSAVPWPGVWFHFIASPLCSQLPSTPSLGLASPSVPMIPRKLNTFPQRPLLPPLSPSPLWQDKTGEERQERSRWGRGG